MPAKSGSGAEGSSECATGRERRRMASVRRNMEGVVLKWGLENMDTAESGVHCGLRENGCGAKIPDDGTGTIDFRGLRSGNEAKVQVRDPGEVGVGGKQCDLFFQRVDCD